MKTKLLILILSFITINGIKSPLKAKTSFDENLVVTLLKENCSTDEPIETYSINNGETTGVLYVVNCESNKLPNWLTDLVNYRFIDTGGISRDRCYGVMNTSTLEGIETNWEVLGSVPGYSCSKVGKKYTISFPKGY